MVARNLIRVIAVVAALALMAAPAAAHVLVVDPPGNDKVVEGWVGGPILPIEAQGAGLFDAPPFAPGHKQSAGHSNGLNNACHATADNSTVAIFGPPTPAGCEHGT
jgi:hypothetical protein